MIVRGITLQETIPTLPREVLVVGAEGLHYHYWYKAIKATVKSNSRHAQFCFLLALLLYYSCRSRSRSYSRDRYSRRLVLSI